MEGPDSERLYKWYPGQERKGLISGSGTSTPPKPPKPSSKATSLTELPSAPQSPSLMNSGSSGPILPSRSQGYGKPPPLPVPDNDAPLLPPCVRDETPPRHPSPPANPIPLPPRENPLPPRVPRREVKESPPPPQRTMLGRVTLIKNQSVLYLAILTAIFFSVL
jgi:hypothetical protein